MVQIYALINPLDNQVFYVGATINPHTRLRQHIASMSHCGNQKEKLINTLLNTHGVEPEMFILDTCTIDESGFWETFYTDLFRMYGFNLAKNISPYKYIKRRTVDMGPVPMPVRYSNGRTKIDGKDIHYYRRQVLNHFKFYQHT